MCQSNVVVRKEFNVLATEFQWTFTAVFNIYVLYDPIDD